MRPLYVPTEHNTVDKSMSCLSQPILRERLSSVGVRPPLGRCKKKSRTTERRREPQKKGLLVLSRCFEVCLFEKPERTAHGGWCKNLATSLALLIDSPSKYYEQSVTTAVSIRRDQCSWTNGNKKHQNKSNVHWEFKPFCVVIQWSASCDNDTLVYLKNLQKSRHWGIKYISIWTREKP